LQLSRLRLASSRRAVHRSQNVAAAMRPFALEWNKI
jgi:hypothetical protein